VKNPYVNYAGAAKAEMIIGNKTKSTNTIRLRFAFKGNQGNPSVNGFGEVIKRVLTEFTKTLKVVDNAGLILTWETNEKEELGIGKQDIPQLSPAAANKYLDVPSYIRTFGTRENSRIGIRIATNMELREFVETWSNMKPRGQAEWMSVNPAEMQTSATAYAVGFLQGSSEKKVLTTINRNLPNELKCKAEISWQYIKQHGVIDYLWDDANNFGEKKVGKKSNQFNKIKFSMGPSALILYVANKEDVKAARKTLLTVYGKEFDEKWPQWCDGSRMKFVPLIGGEIQNEKAREQVTTRIKWQIHSKVNEVTLELPLTDIQEVKSYLRDQSMEQVILGTMTDSDRNLPLFKHITHKYTKNLAETKYQVTVYKAMDKEELLRLEQMKDVMHTQFGNDVFQHFDDKHKGLMVSHSKRRDYTNHEYDEETESWLADEHATDKEEILEPGFTDFLTMEAVKGPDSTIHDVSTANNSKESNESQNSVAIAASSTNTEDSAVSEYSSVSTISWIGDLTRGKDSKDWRESSRVQRKLDKANITSAQLESWKVANPETEQILLLANDRNIYSTTKQIVVYMIKERQLYIENQQKTGTAEAGFPGHEN